VKETPGRLLLEVVLERTDQLESSGSRALEEKCVRSTRFTAAGAGMLPEEGAIGAVGKAGADPSKIGLTERLLEASIGDCLNQRTIELVVLHRPFFDASLA
jgi:hypothetical protein